MSIQPLSISSPTPEPAAQRRRAAEPESGRETEAFALPEEAAEQTPAPAGQAAEPRAVAEPATAQGEKPAEPASQPAGPADGTRPAETAQLVTAAPATQPKLDIGALVAIAAAAQAEGNVPGKGGKVAEKDQAETAAPEAKTGDATAPDVAPQVPAQIVVAPAPVLSLIPALAPALVSADPAAEIAVPSDGVAPAGEAAAKPTAAANPAAQLALLTSKPELAGTAELKVAIEAGTEDALSQAASGGGQISTLAAKDGGIDKLAQPTAPAALPPEFKPLEALQQALSPIDLSALGQQGAAKPEPLRLLSGLEQPAPTPQSAPLNGQATAGGQPTPLHMVPIEIGLRALSGAKQFDIRLDPGELGRVDVSLKISDSGEVSARLVVDRVETLHLLQRDARTLERAFEQAGLKPSDAGVDITLRDPADQSGFRQNRQQDEAPRRAQPVAETGDETAIPAQSAPVRRLVRLGGVDLSI